MAKNKKETDESPRLKEVEALYDGHGNAITKDSQYLGYGILIALFYFHQKSSWNGYKLLAILTTSCAILSLISQYIYSLITFKSCEKILDIRSKLRGIKKEVCSSECLNAVVEAQFTVMRPKSMFFYWLFQGLLALSILLFIIVACFYFLGGCL
jgi:hypothetical protein